MIDPRLYNKANPHRNLERETRPSAGSDIYGQLGIPPVFKLVATHEKIATGYRTDLYVGTSHPEFAFLKAHGLGAIAATTTLVKHELPMDGAKCLNYFFSFGCD
jgi:hypothetical protein